jgi:translocation and assembly module TamB
MIRVIKWTLSTILLLPVLLIAVVLVALNVAPGQRWVESEVKSLTGGMVMLEGLGGVFPMAPRLARFELNDATGAWLVVQDLALDWSPLDLLHGDAHVDRLAAGDIAVARLPQSSSAASSSGGGFSLPVRVDIDKLAVGRVSVAAPVAGTAALLSIDGQAHLASLETGSAALSIQQLDGPGRYTLSGQLDASHLVAHVDLAEPTQGLLARLAQVPELGALSVHADLDGPRDAGVLKLAVTAGPLRADAAGTIDLVGQSLALDVTANAPEMHPRADIGWSAIALDVHVHGAFTRPDAAGSLQVDQFTGAGAAIAHLATKISGNAGQVQLDASAAGLRIPGAKPDLLAASPLQLTAQMQLDSPTRPVQFSLTHKLITAKGEATTGEVMGGSVALALPDLAPFAAVGGVDLQGSAQFDVKTTQAGGTTRADLDGKLHISGGMAPVPDLLGDATLAAAAALDGQDIRLSHLELNGRTVKLQAKGALIGGKADADGTLALSDLHVLSPALAGSLQAKFHTDGPTDDLSAQADLDGDVTVQGHRGPLKASVTASGLPNQPIGHVLASGVLDGAPLSADINVQRDADGAMQANIARTEWKSAHIEGDLTLAPGATLPQGHVGLRMTRLADLDPLIGQNIVGGIELTADLPSADVLRVQLNASHLGMPGTAEIGAALLKGEVRDPTSHPVVDANLSVDALQAGAISGSAKVSIKGPQEALALRVESALHGVAGADATIATTATIDALRRLVTVAGLQANWKGLDTKLLGPARVDLAQGVSVDKLRIGVGSATVELAGRAAPTLDLTAAVRHVTPELAQVFAPDLQADGTLQADARLTGTPARPTGTVKLVAEGLHMRTGPARSLPRATITANADLQGTTTRIDVRVSAGANRVSVTGQAPLATSGAIDLHASGGLDLALLDPILSAQGRRLQGQLALDAKATGSFAAPVLSGNVQLTRGDFQDFTQGVHLSAMQATLEAAGDQVRISQFSAHAGAGTINATGTVGVLAPDMPVNITVTARNAKPLATDLLSAVLDADLTLSGQVQGHLAAGGKVHIRTANIQVPENLPPSIAVLNVRVPGQKPPKPPAPGPDIALNLDLDAPSQIFVRGRGLDAEMAGKMHIGGTAAEPRPSGGFQMIRGIFSLAGVTLNFASGDVSFNGASKIDPTLKFVANSSNGSTTATLTVGGYASAPKITLSSVPDLPQDEVLAYLLFRTSAANLTPFQLAEIAGALAQISGVTGGAGDPLATARKALGLDQLNVGSNSNGSPTLNAGRYVAKGVYVGAKQGVGGSAGTQATVQIDITKGLKLETDAGSGAGSNSVGLKYQFEY